MREPLLEVRKRGAAWMMAACLAIGLLGGCEQQKVVSAVDFALDTVVTAAVYGLSEDELRQLLYQCREYEEILSKTRQDSDVWRINNSGGQPVEVSEHTAAILRKAQEISAMTDGAFDVTVASAVKLWDFTGSEPQLPSETALTEAVALTDYRRLEIEGNIVRLPEGMSIDLGGIAKGYIADALAQQVQRIESVGGTLNLGGNVHAIGRKPDGDPWLIGIQDPQKQTGESIGALEVSDMAVVTSGVYQRSFQKDGKLYHHILDPATGRPVDNGLSSVTVIAESGMAADALSTACFVLGQERGLALLESIPDTEGIFIDKNNNISTTPGLSGFILLEDAETNG